VSDAPPVPGPVAVVGTGLIGTSIALAARAAGAEVRGFDPDPAALAGAADRGALSPAGSLEAALEGATVAIVASPMDRVVEVVLACLRANPAVVVTDAGSSKSDVVGSVGAQASPGDAARFVGGHPMTGSERSGPGAASASLLDGTVWVLCPGEGSDPASVAVVESLVRAVGAQPLTMDAARHDRLVALVSHLPQLASTALMRVAAVRAAGEPELLMMAAGGFRDLTRLAASNPELWPDILLANADRVRDAIGAYVEALGQLGELLERGDREALVDVFRRSKEARLALGARPQAKVGVAILAVPIPDRPGVLADVTSTLGAEGINIEDLEIVHSAEGAKGTLHATVAEGSAEAAVAALAGRGYEVGRLA
jgi:prephenate dehydrogenase